MERSRRQYWDFRHQTAIGWRDNPLPLSEQLAPPLAEAGMRHFSEAKTAHGLVHSAWRIIEFGLAQSVPLSDELRRLYINTYASQVLGDVLALNKDDNPLRHQQPDYTCTPNHTHFHHALLIGAHLPLFAKRATGQQVTRDDTRELHASMVCVLQEELALDEDTQQTARLSETVSSLLASRTGLPEYILYPASPREESSHKQQHNHDRYFVQHNTKIPVQIKIGQTAARYLPEIAVLDIEGMLQFSATRAHLDSPPKSTTIAPHVHRAAELISLEHDGEFLYPEERMFLNTASQAIVKLATSSEVAHKSA